MGMKKKVIKDLGRGVGKGFGAFIKGRVGRHEREIVTWWG